MALFGYLQLNPSQDILAVPIHAAFVGESEVVVQADLLDLAALQEFDYRTASNREFRAFLQSLLVGEL